MGSSMQDTKPKMTRVLALHGYGTSGEIFRSQTAAFRLKLPKQSYTFTFPNAPLPSAPTVGVDSIWNQNPKFYAWWPAQSSNTSEIRAAHDQLDQLLFESKEGPFDLVMGFSQGCSLLMSYILYRYQEHLTNPQLVDTKFELPFKGVMFICGGPSLPVLQDLGVPVSERAWEVHHQTAALLHKRTEKLKFKADNPDTIRRGEGLWDEVDDLIHDPTSKKHLRDLRDVFGLDFTDERMRKAVGDLGEIVPTVHVYGGKDPRWPASVQLAQLFEGGMNERFDHGGGHELPRTTECSVRVAELMEKLRRRVEGSDGREEGLRN
ncbi:serine hydrolase-domain-containing protein [Pseudoneurospora amorphoporcata]|uniref:Serine hydrolase-domain-containing protein n=1 Tax=Pseudoneurospora amorphoporcata TaxID=241081 RepID=A0AAN6P058_9PEZI|nr:serine hydrolase-domain-containing protein [Pseudoneurospora amorphoporcata]